MNSQTAREQLEVREAELAALVEQRDTVTADLQAIQEEQAAAVRKLAAGNGKERKLILELETRKTVLNLQVKDLAGLVSGAETTVTQARGTLGEAQAQERAAEQEAARVAEFNACEAIAAAIPEMERRIGDAYCKLSDLLADLTMQWVRLQEHPGPGRQVLNAFLEKLPFRVDDRLHQEARRGFRMGPVLRVFPTVKNEGDVAAAFPTPVSPPLHAEINPLELHQVRKPGIMQAHIREF